MAELEELVLKISADTGELNSSLKSATNSLQKQTQIMQDSVSKFAKSGAKDSSYFQNAISTMAGFIGGQVVIGAFNKLSGAAVGFFKSLVIDGVSAAAATEAALNDVVGALARTGNASKDSKKSMEEFSGALQDMSIYGDDAVLSAASLIQNIAKLGEDDLKTATQAAADLASTLNIDLSSAASLIGKGIEGNTAAFKRYGLSVEEGSSKSENFANVMKALANQQGAAAAKLQTYSGQTALLKNTWEDFTKIVGNAIVQNPAIISAMAALNTAIKDIGKALSTSGPEFKMFIAEILKPMAGVFNTVAQASLFFLSSVNSLKLGPAVNQLDNLETAQSNNRIELEKAEAALKRGGAGYVFFGKSAADTIPILKAKAEALDEQVAKQRALVSATEESNSKVDESINQISNSIAQFAGQVTSFDTVKAGVESVQEPVNTLKDKVVELSAATLAAQAINDEFVKSLVSGFDSVTERNNAYLEEYKFQNDNKIISDEAFNMARQALIADNQASETAMLDEWYALNKGKTEEYEIAKLALAHKYSLLKQNIAADEQRKEAAMMQQRLALGSQFFGNLATLTRSGSKELAAIGKAAAIAQATIDGYAAIQKALASAPPPFNFALAASVGIATAGNIAKIASTPLASGIDQVPGVGNSDNFPAILAPGERVVPTKTNEDLTRFLAEGGGRSGAQITVNVTMNDIFTSDPREMGLKIINTINEAAQANGIQLLGNQIR